MNCNVGTCWLLFLHHILRGLHPTCSHNGLLILQWQSGAGIFVKSCPDKALFYIDFKNECDENKQNLKSIWFFIVVLIW